jgi:uncharacterized protein DUF3631
MSHTVSKNAKQEPVKARTSAERRCPSCGGHKDLDPGTGTRCTAYTEDGWQTWACTREQFAGMLTPVRTAAGDAWVHRADKCPCRIRHGVLPPTPTDDADDKPEGCTRAEYAAHAGFDTDSLEFSRLDFVNCGCVTSKFRGLKSTAFPWQTVDGAVVWHHRISISREPRFKWGRGASPLTNLEPFGIQTLALAKQRGFAILPEGESDAQRLILEDFPVLASPGKDTWQPTWNRHLEGITPFVVDEGGEGAAHVRQVGKDLAVRARMRILSFAPWNAKDPNALFQLDREKFRERMEQAMADAKTWEAWSAEQRESAPNPWDTFASLRETAMKDRQPHWNAWLETVAPYEPHERDALLTEGCKFFGTKRATAEQALAKILGPTAPGGSTLTDPKPWPEPVNGADILDEFAATYRKYTVLPKHGPETLALWSESTYAIDAFDLAAILALKSPTKRCGKTRVVKVASRCVRRPLVASNATSATIYRSVEAFHPTLLLDEAETYLTGKDNEQMRGVINCGHERDTAIVLRIAKVGDDLVPMQLSAFSARLFAYIDKKPPHQMPDTVEDRSIILPMARRTKKEPVARLRATKLAAELEPLRQKAWAWAQANLDALREADPSVPDALGDDDRAIDNWLPLFAIADLVGGEWPKRARDAAVALSGARLDDDRGVQLLADIRALAFSGDNSDKTVVFTDPLLRLLTGDPERPWATYNRGKPMGARQLSQTLKPFKISRPGTVRDGEATAKGYYRDAFEDAWARYLPSNPSQASQPNKDAGKTAQVDPSQNPSVTDAKTSESPVNTRGVTDVTDKSTVPEGYERTIHGAWFNPDTGTYLKPNGATRPERTPA